MKAAATLAVLVALALSACSAQEEKAPEVASLATGQETFSPTTQAQQREEERPRQRLDMTPEDLEALEQPYWQCISDFGINGKGKLESDAAATAPKSAEGIKMAAAQKACESKYPLPPWEKDPANPEAHDFTVRVVQCLRDRGVRYAEVTVDESTGGPVVALGGEGNDPESMSKGLQHMQDCERVSSGQ